uniref:DUF727 domain-containing protein n=1 Tax=Bursaphelenchus xylophilus TaxID=6326 RepID=A0A1I7SJE9_BURXY
MVRFLPLDQVPHCRRKTATIELSVRGWRICSTNHNEPSGEIGDFPKDTYETLSALLTTISDGYKEAFAGSLVQRLEELSREEDKEGQQ